jgi:acetolactate synthase small subunit
VLAVGDLNKEELVEKEVLVIFLKELGKAARKEENR